MDGRHSTTDGGVQVRTVSGVTDLREIESLLATVWRHPPGSVELDITLLVALAGTGHYVAGAYRGEELIGAGVAFLAEPFPVTLYSHVIAVLPERAARGTGRALKMHQRAWCLERGITGVRWTFDPLLARNARLNLSRLGALPIRYLQDYYGDLRDGLNLDAGSDRLLVHWDLTDLSATSGPASTEAKAAPLLVGAGPRDEPVPDRAALGAATRCRIQIPGDIDGIRTARPDIADRWRKTVRDELGRLMAGGWRVTGFDEDRCYLLLRQSPTEHPTRRDTHQRGR